MRRGLSIAGNGASKTFVCGFVAVIGLLLWSEYSSWQARLSLAKTSLSQTARGVAQHTDDLIEMSRLPLASLAATITSSAADPDLASRLKSLIALQMKASPSLDTLSYIDADGRLIANSSDVPLSQFNFADREYFRFHVVVQDGYAVVGRPIKSRISGKWGIPVSQRVTLADGAFGGVVLSVVPISHFIEFFNNFDLGKEGSFLLACRDGTVLARAPLDDDLLGTNMSSHELFTRYLRQASSGAYSYTSPVDGVDRVGGYYQSQRSGVVVLVASSEWLIFLDWVSTAWIRWSYAGGLIILIVLAARYWRAQAAIRRLNEASLEKREAEFRLLAEASSDVITRFDANAVRQYVSPASAQVLGMPAEFLIGRAVGLDTDAPREILLYDAIGRIHNGSARETFVVNHIKPDGDEVWLEIALTPLPSTDDPVPDIVAVTRDVTHHKQAERELGKLANTDELTRLANRRAFNNHFDMACEISRNSGNPLSALMIDVDHFKLFNDRYGHGAGDTCLEKIADTLKQSVTSRFDMAARYGGEEFVVVLSDTDGRGGWAAAERIRLAIKGLSIPHLENQPSGVVTVSIGMATFSGDASIIFRPHILLSRADDALYEAKREGRDRVAADQEPWGQTPRVAKGF